MDLQFGIYYFTMYFVVDIDVVASEFYLLTIYPFFYQVPNETTDDQNDVEMNSSSN